MLSCGLPLSPAGTSPTYKLFVSTKQSVNPFKLDAPPPPPAAASTIPPEDELYVSTCPSVDPRPGILKRFIFASTKVISLDAVAELKSAS